jgi:hypothetical protein
VGGVKGGEGSAIITKLEYGIALMRFDCGSRSLLII